MEQRRKGLNRRGHREGGFRNIFKQSARGYTSPMGNAGLISDNSDMSWFSASSVHFHEDMRSMKSDLPSIGSFAGAASISQMFSNSWNSTKRFGSSKNMKKPNHSLAFADNTYGVAVADEGPSPFGCTICGKVLTSRTALKTHVMQQHEGKVVIKCPHCDRAFTRQSQLGKHIDACHDERTGEFYCDKCPFKNRDLEVFNQHVHAHNICKFCRNEFTQLTRHEPKCPYRQ